MLGNIIHKVIINSIYASFSVGDVFVGSEKNELVGHNAGKKNVFLITKSIGNKARKDLQEFVAEGKAVFLVNKIKAFKIGVDNGVILRLTADDHLLHLLTELGEGNESGQGIGLVFAESSSMAGIKVHAFGVVSGDNLGQLVELLLGLA